MSYAMPSSLFIINVCVFFEQFGYGFGFTAYMLYLIYYSQGEYKTLQPGESLTWEVKWYLIPLKDAPAPSKKLLKLVRKTIK